MSTFEIRHRQAMVASRRSVNEARRLAGCLNDTGLREEADRLWESAQRLDWKFGDRAELVAERLDKLVRGAKRRHWAGLAAAA